MNELGRVDFWKEERSLLITRYHSFAPKLISVGCLVAARARWTEWCLMSQCGPLFFFFGTTMYFVLYFLR